MKLLFFLSFILFGVCSAYALSQIQNKGSTMTAMAAPSVPVEQAIPHQRNGKGWLFQKKRGGRRHRLYTQSTTWMKGLSKSYINTLALYREAFEPPQPGMA